MWSKGLARASTRARQLRGSLDSHNTVRTYAKWPCPDKQPEGPSEYDEAGRTKSFLNAPKTPMSDEMRAKLNKEFGRLAEDFAFGKDLLREIADEAVDAAKGNGKPLDRLRKAAEELPSPGNRPSFPHLEASEKHEPYTEAELFARRAHHAHRIVGMGADVSEDVYRPHEDLHKPAERASIAALIAAGAHLGHIKANLRANCLPFIYGERDGIHIIDLEQTLSALRRACRVVEGISERAGTILFVGTRDGHEQIVRTGADRAHGYYVHGRWIPGTITNGENIAHSRKRVELDMADMPTDRNLSSKLENATSKPDLVISLSPVENRAMLMECLAARVPTIGIVDTDSEPSLLTYPIPGNDDSMRFCSLVVGLLSNAAKRGRDRRIADFYAYEEAREQAKSGKGFNKEPKETTGQYATLSEEEITLAQQ